MAYAMLCQEQYSVFIFPRKIKEANAFLAATFVSEKILQLSSSIREIAMVN